MTFTKFYSNKVIQIINDQSDFKTNQIFVFLGQVEFIDRNSISDYLSDAETFYLNGNENLFNKTWFANIFTSLNSERKIHLLSFAQFSYLVNYIDGLYFKDRVVIIRDNLRQLFPINENEYLEVSTDENIATRPVNIPIYQAEQFQIGKYYFYSVKALNDDYREIDLFNEERELLQSNNSEFENIDISSDLTSLDYFINTCILENNLNKKALVKIYIKQALSQSFIRNLAKVNFILNQFGGALFLLKEEFTKENYEVSQTTLDLLLKHGGGKQNSEGLKYIEILISVIKFLKYHRVLL